MKRFRNILVATSDREGLERAVEVAGALAKRNGALLRLVDVVRPFPSYARMLGPDVHVDELQEGATMKKLEALEQAAGALRSRGLQVKTDVLWGRPFIEIIREVQRCGHDLVVKTAGEAGGLSSALFGSVDLHLLRKCPCPLWLLKPEGEPSLKRVLAAVDVGAEAEESRALNRLILELSTSLSVTHEAEIHVVHCWEAPGESLLQRRVPPKEMERYRTRVLSRATALFRELLADFSEAVPAEHQHLLEGAPENRLVRFAEDERVDLIVMGTVGRSGIPGLLIGNTAEKVLSRVRCALLSAKPTGFVSPVEVPSTTVTEDGGNR